MLDCPELVEGLLLAIFSLYWLVNTVFHKARLNFWLGLVVYLEPASVILCILLSHIDYG
jgi:hypothetical protein